MNRSILTAAVFLTLTAGVYAGDYSGKEMRQAAPPPCPEWYADNEWNVSLWGTYAFTNTDYSRNLWLVDLVQSTTEGHTVYGTYDRYIGGDHAWGGGADVKYFFHRYFGVGIEGFILDANKGGFEIFENPRIPIFLHERTNHRRAIGSILGTFTLRYPVPCTRFAPYAYAGVGAIFGGGEHDTVFAHSLVTPPDALVADAFTVHHGSETKFLTQFGAGLETRITHNIGWINDLSWGVIEGPKNNFGMFRSGINFAF
jgi:opacity protein-like surface antigen